MEFHERGSTMAKTKHDLMKDASEIVHYDSAGIPLYVKSDFLSEYPEMRALCHWHDDLEFIRIREGEMYYKIGSRTVLPQTRRPHSPGRIRTALPSAPWSPISSRIIQAGSPWTISPPRGMSAGANAAASSGTVCSRLPLISSISTGSRSAGVCCWRTDSV